MTTALRQSVSFILIASMAIVLSGCRATLFDRAANFWSLSCCGAVAVILAIIALIELAGSPRPTINKVLWALLIIFAPILGVILYYLFGRD